MPPVIEARGLTRRFGATTALNDLDLRAPAGQVTAVLGPNGAGKTTFVRAVATLLRPDSGELYVDGIDAVRDPGQVRRCIGLAGQYAAVEQAMTGRENLRMIARLFGHDRRKARAAADAVLEQLGLADAADRLVRTYSGGLRRRLDLGASLVGAPRLLLLDEPTTGLDPRSRIELWDALRVLVAHGTDVLLTTQYLEEADQLADRIVIIDHGTAIASGTPGELKARAGADVIEVRVRSHGDVRRAADALAALGTGPARADSATHLLSLPVERGAEQLMKALPLLLDHDVAVDDIALRRPTLDEVFLALTGAPTTPDTTAEPASPAGSPR